MKTFISIIKDETVFIVIILCATSFLLLCNLGNQYLWQDEAETAAISKTILTHGIPLGYDGKNYLSQEGDIAYTRDYVWRYTPWLQFYMTAASFVIFDVKTFSARLPFALLGISTVLLTYYFSKALFENRKTAVIASLILILSVPFLILSRQCRYYSLIIFFTLLGLYGYITIFRNRRKGIIILILSSTLLFHSNHLHCAILLATVSIHAIIYHRSKITFILLICFVIAVINVPWIICFSGLKYGERYGTTIDNQRFSEVFFEYISLIIKYIFHPALLAIPIFMLAGMWYKSKRFPSTKIYPSERVMLLIFLVVFTVPSVSVFCAYPFFRYLGPIIPVFSILIAVIITSVMRIHILLGIILFIILSINSSMSDYLYEITHDYDGPIEGIVKYLQQHGKEEETVLITYGDMPLKFYTNMKVIGIEEGGEDLSDAHNSEWIIVRKETNYGLNFYRIENLFKRIPWEKYEKIVLDYPDTRFENREDPIEHNFRTKTGVEKVVIHKKK